jgi:broad specificity phosphatase PhoE
MSRMLGRRLILVKHALPELRAGLSPREWHLDTPGREGAKRLSKALEGLGPLRLEHSPELKAAQTAEIVAIELGVGRHERRGFEEIDRVPERILPRDAYVAHNARLFTEPTESVVGTESAEHALSRFHQAVDAAVSATLATEHLAVVTHGTVIALFVAAHNAIEAFSLWQRLSCPSLVLLALPDYELLEVRDTI